MMQLLLIEAGQVFESDTEARRSAASAMGVGLSGDDRSLHFQREVAFGSVKCFHPEAALLVRGEQCSPS